jgi:hypothetical protein
MNLLDWTGIWLGTGQASGADVQFQSNPDLVIPAWAQSIGKSGVQQFNKPIPDLWHT